MRSFFLIGALLCSLGALSQNCNAYYFLQNNKTIEMEITDTKGKPNGKLVYSVSDVQTSGGVTTAKVHSQTMDKKEKVLGTAECTMKCDGGKMMMDMKMSMPVPQGGSGKQPQSIDASASGDEFYIEYPASMKDGDELPDAHASFSIDMGTGMTQKFTIDNTERKVGAKEKVTTPAGSWDCYKITSRSKIRVEMMGIGVPMQTEQTEWFAPDFGVVKTSSKYGDTQITAVK